MSIIVAMRVGAKFPVCSRRKKEESERGFILTLTGPRLDCGEITGKLKAISARGLPARTNINPQPSRYTTEEP